MSEQQQRQLDIYKVIGTKERTEDTETSEAGRLGQDPTQVPLWGWGGGKEGPREGQGAGGIAR